MSAEAAARVEDTLRRIDDLVSGLSHIADTAGRDAARELVEVVLDLHGLALARIMAIAAAEGSATLLDRLAADEAVKAVLLLYGLHPQDAATRIRLALEPLRPRLAAAGIAAGPVRIAAGRAAIRLCGDAADAERVRREIETAIVDAAPELDEIVVEWMDDADATEPAALAG